MNWLAHLHLGGPDPLERLGHLCGDFVRGTTVDELPAALRRGVLHHRRIDAFTDRHELVRRSRAQIPDGFRRWSGVLVDVFYDHLLARGWVRHAPDAPPLRRFVDGVHADLVAHRPVLPPRLAWIAPRMIREDWLSCYGTVEGVRGILRRMEGRLRRPFPLAAAADLLAGSADLLERDFAAFYPELRAFAADLRDGGVGVEAARGGSAAGGGSAVR